MKKLYYIISLFSITLATAQQKIDTIYVNQFKSSQIVFSEDTTFDFIDIGTGDLHITYRQLNNVVVIQSIVDALSYINTNIFIKTKNNGIFNFIVAYDNKPKDYTYFVQNDTKKINAIHSNAATNTPASKNILINNIINYKQKPFKPSTDYISDTKCEFYGLFFYEKKVYYKIKIVNDSFLDYTIKDFYVYAKNKKSRRTADSERVKKPIKIHTNSETIKGKSEEYIVLEFDQFTLNKKEELIIEVKEASDGQRDYKVILPYYITNTPIIL